MSEKGMFYNPGEVDFSKIVPAYQEAFSGWPWFEVSKCVDTSLKQRCAGGLSSTALRQTCIDCGNTPSRPAYEADELIERFQNLETTRPTRWYLESVNDKPALVALAWSALPKDIAEEKYSDVPKMQDWLIEKFGDEPIIWLDEVFADKSVRPSGNLSNFSYMCKGFMSALRNSELAYRTISPAMIRVAEKDFNVNPENNVPDRRALIVIEKEI